MNTPHRTADTMSEAIALSSPSGRMSGRARRAAQKRLSVALFGPTGLTREQLTGVQPPTNAQQATRKREYAQFLRGLAAGGMKPRAHIREAMKLEAEANELECLP
jgi:hypothetical protein